MACVILLVVLLILFILMELMPGSPFNNPEITPEQRARIEEKYGLDQPFLTRYFIYLKNMLRGDFGVSYNIQQNLPVADLLSKRFPVTIQIGVMAICIGVFFGIVLGITAGFHHNKLADSVASTVAIICASLPSFAFALLLPTIKQMPTHLQPGPVHRTPSTPIKVGRRSAAGIKKII